MKNTRGRLVIGLILVLVLSGAFALRQVIAPRYEKYTDSFLDTFDTVTIIVAYTRTEAEFEAYFDKAHQRFQELHRLYNIYYDYPGINNIKTINDNAGIRPVKVDREIIDLILFAKDWHNRTEGKTNIAMGAVLGIWHEYREAGRDDPALAKLPPMDELREAASHTNMDDIIVDVKSSTVYLSDSRMRLDVGAVAKGYATELVAREMEAAGLKSAMISAGGNIRAIGKPLDGVRERWGVGIQDPKASLVADDGLLDVVFVNDASVVSSGDYQRYYVVDGQVLHHIIDPATLMPGDYYRAVSVVTKDSGAADLLSTELFLLPFEKSKALAESLEGVEALWVMEDGRVEVTEGMSKIMRSHGASGAHRR
ncbi:MAG: FAD:protein FMN transferase [Firmicutes bacterium]|nr:FAD:protein FMN transferase [Bacillota bacterium]